MKTFSKTSQTFGLDSGAGHRRGAGRGGFGALFTAEKTVGGDSVAEKAPGGVGFRLGKNSGGAAPLPVRRVTGALPYSTFSIRYPMPTWVWMNSGESGDCSSFLRSVTMNTRREAMSLSQLRPQMFWVI